MAFLLIQRPGEADERFSLADTEVRIGRLSDNELAIDEPSLSRYHAVISATGDGHTVVDLGSRNGTRVNGQLASDAPVQLRPGDDVALGSQGVVLRYLADDARSGDITGFFGTVPAPGESTVSPAVVEDGERWMKVLRVTPWLRFVGAAAGSLAAVLALAWWIIRWLVP